MTYVQGRQVGKWCSILAYSCIMTRWISYLQELASLIEDHTLRLQHVVWPGCCGGINYECAQKAAGCSKHLFAFNSSRDGNQRLDSKDTPST